MCNYNIITITDFKCVERIPLNGRCCFNLAKEESIKLEEIFHIVTSKKKNTFIIYFPALIVKGDDKMTSYVPRIS